MLGLFRDTLPANVKFPFRDSENLVSPIQMQLSLKMETFSDFFVPFLQSTSNFKHFEKNYDRYSYFITEISGCERLG